MNPIKALKTLFAGEPGQSSSNIVLRLFRHPFSVVEAFVHFHAAELVAALVKAIEARNPGVKIVLDEVTQVVHDHMGPAVVKVVDHILGPPLPMATAAPPAIQISPNAAVTEIPPIVLAGSSGGVPPVTVSSTADLK